MSFFVINNWGERLLNSPSTAVLPCIKISRTHRLWSSGHAGAVGGGQAVASSG